MFAGQSGMNVFKWRSQNDSTLDAHLLEDGPPEIELSDYRRYAGSETDSPSGLLNGDGLKTEPISDLDIFFEELYRYYREKGLRCIVVKWIVEILSVIFVEFFIWFFLLVVDWPALRNVKCGVDALESGSKPCDLAKEAIKEHPLVPFTFSKGIIVGSMVILTIYGLFNFLKFIVQFKSTLKVREFYYNSLHMTDSEIQTTPWPSILDKVIQLQQSHRLCVVKDLSAHDIVMRMMRKENYLIAMLNKGVLAFPVYWWVPGVGPAVKFKENGKKYNLILPKTLEWTLNWCIFQSMFDSKFCIQKEFLMNPSLLRKRLMFVGIGMFLISPCLVIFMLVYLFLRHAEQFYNHPSTASSRRWSNLSNWIFREFNEVEHLFRYRISNSILHASNYLKQFPAPLVTIVAKFISFVSGGLAAILIIIAFMDESLLEGHIFGRNLFWYAAIFGSVTAISRAAISDELQVLDHEGAMSLVVQYTHYMPKRWRGRENRGSVLSEFESLFQYTGMMLLEEMVSIFLTPILLIFVVPKRVDDILHFISDYTVYIEGVGHVCSFSVFDFESHGSTSYGSPYDAAKERRSSQGKMEKSFLSFQCTYSTWEPGEHGRRFLATLQNFMEKQINLDQLHGYPLSPTWQSTRGLRYQSELNHRIPARVHVYNGFFPSNSRQASGWLNLDSKTHPYILDWYYRSKPRENMENWKDQTFPETNIFFEKSRELQGTRNKLPKEIENEDESWELPYFGRLQSQLEASSSSSIFRNPTSPDPRLQSHLEASTSSNLLRNSSQGQELGNHTINQWWQRPGPNSSVMKTSFIEPPSFGNQNYSRSNMADSTTQMQDYEHGDRVPSNLNNVSHTMYIGESDDDDDGELKLPFVDDYDGSFGNFSVKIVPRSNDRIS